MDILHNYKNLKSLFPKIDVVTRQNANIKKRIMKNIYGNNLDQSNSIQPAGNFKYHNSRYVCCKRIEDGK